MTAPPATLHATSFPSQFASIGRVSRRMRSQYFDGLAADKLSGDQLLTDLETVPSLGAEAAQ